MDKQNTITMEELVDVWREWAAAAKAIMDDAMATMDEIQATITAQTANR